MSIEDEKEFDRVLNDILFLGQGFVKDGKRVPPEDVYLDRYDILVEGIKELIATTRNKDAEVFSANDLQKLITKEEYQEIFDGTINQLNSLTIRGNK